MKTWENTDTNHYLNIIVADTKEKGSERRGNYNHNTIIEATNKLPYVNRSQILTIELFFVFFLVEKTLAF